MQEDQLENHYWGQGRKEEAWIRVGAMEMKGQDRQGKVPELNGKGVVQEREVAEMAPKHPAQTGQQMEGKLSGGRGLK